MKKQIFLVFVIYLVIWYGISFCSKALFSGYHIEDDHEIISIHNEFVNKSSFLQILIREIKDDLQIRLRPLYYFERIVTIKIFGDNLLIFSFYKIFLVIISSVFLFFSARSFNFGTLESFLVPILSFLGVQSNIWFWRGPAESSATLLFCLALYSLCKYLKHENILWNLLFVFSCISMSLIKENYGLTIPALCAFMICLEKHSKKLSWLKALKNNFIVYFILIFYLFLELTLIKFVIGDNQIGYAGFELNIFRFFSVFIQFFVYNFQGVVLVILLIFSLYFKILNKQYLFIYSMIFLFFFIPQVVIYAKSGLLSSEGRYLLPAAIGFSMAICSLLNLSCKTQVIIPQKINLILISFLFVIGIVILMLCLLILLNKEFCSFVLLIISSVKGNPIAEHWHDKLLDISKMFSFIGFSIIILVGFLWFDKQLKNLFLYIVFIMLIYCLLTAFIAGRNFYIEGENLRHLFDEAKNKINRNCLIVIVADPGFNVEEVASVTKYLNIKLNFKNIKYFFIDSNLKNTDYIKEWKNITLKLYGDKAIKNILELNSAKCLFILKEMDKIFINYFAHNLSKQFDIKKFGSRVCCIRK